MRKWFQILLSKCNLYRYSSEDKDGATPVDMAEDEEHEEAAALLKASL